MQDLIDNFFDFNKTLMFIEGIKKSFYKIRIYAVLICRKLKISFETNFIKFFS